jgi:hypothetical protein
MLQNFKSMVGKTCFWLISQVTTKLEHIGDERINNLITKMVVYLSEVWIVGTTRKHQNDQISTQEFPVFWGGEYSKSSEYPGANENDVANWPSLQNMHQKEAPLIRHSSWHRKDCGLIDPKGVFFAKSWVRCLT